MNCCTYPEADCNTTDHQLLVATLKVRLAKRQHTISPLNLEELKEEKAVQFATEMTNRLIALSTTVATLVLSLVISLLKSVCCDFSIFSVYAILTYTHHHRLD